MQARGLTEVPLAHTCARHARILRAWTLSSTTSRETRGAPECVLERSSWNSLVAIAPFFVVAHKHSHQVELL